MCHVSVRPSQIRNGGFGLFAEQDFQKGQDIVLYKGELLTEPRTGDYVMAPFKNLIIDAGKPDAGLGRFANCIRPFNILPNKDNSTHNAEYIASPVKKTVWIRASKTIRKGHEIFVNYGDDYRGQWPPMSDADKQEQAHKKALHEAKAAAKQSVPTLVCQFDEEKIKQTAFRVDSMQQLIVEHDITENTRDTFRTQGYVYYRKLLSPDVCRELGTLVSFFEKRKLGTTTRMSDFTELAGAKGIPSITNEVRGDDQARFKSIVNLIPRDLGIQKLIATLLKGLPYTIPDAFVYFRIRAQKDNTVVHSDWSFFARTCPVGSFPIHPSWGNLHHPVKGEPLPFFTLWIPLTSCTPLSGSLALAPASHTCQPKNRDPHKLLNQFRSPAFDPRAATWASSSFKCGDVLAFEARTIHAGTINQSPLKEKRFSLDFRIVGGVSSYVPIDPDIPKKKK
jgi:hypothetical protein